MRIFAYLDVHGSESQSLLIMDSVVHFEEVDMIDGDVMVLLARSLPPLFPSRRS